MGDAAPSPRVASGVGAGSAALYGALALYLGLTGVLLWLALARTGGEFTYAQDDPYIHLALARTLAEHGVWGIRPEEFASASSSPLWTLLLAGFWKLGARQVWIPFALNIAFGCVLLVVVVRWLRTAAASDADSSERLAVPPVAVLAALVVVTPLPTLAFVGMEHTLQILLVVIFALQAADRLRGAVDGWVGPSLVAAAMVATRYESLFVVAIVGAMLAWKGQWRAAATLGVIVSLPVIGFGWYSIVHGGLALPNSVLMKSGPSRFPNLSSGFSAVLSDWVAVRALFQRPPQLTLTIAVLVGLMLVPPARLAKGGDTLWLSGIFLGASLLHACLVKLEWFYRYEAYLMVLGLLSLAGLSRLVVWPTGLQRKRGHPPHPAVVPLLVLLALPLAIRALGALATTPRAVGNVFEQQVQLGRFFARHYAGRPVAVNDLGAVAWLSSSRILDIVGLASQEVADLKRHRALTAAALDRLASDQRVEAVAIYEDVFAPILPSHWVKVGEWTIEGNVAVSGASVAFFAPDGPSAARLREALDAFSKELPARVTWTARAARIPAPISAKS